MPRPSYQLVPATVEHIAAMEGRIRPADVAELQAAAGLTPCQVMENGLALDQGSVTFLADGIPLCMAGCTVLSEVVGLPWMVGTQDLERHRRAFLLESRRVFEVIQARRSYLVNWVDARNRKAVRWLAWLGFTIHPATPHGLEGLPFHMFTRRAHVQ